MMMKIVLKFLKRYLPIILILLFALITQFGFYRWQFNGGFSKENADWAHFATYFGLTFSVLSVVLLFLTYRSQTKMSAVLQFESVFFQWHQQHRAIYKSLKTNIDSFSKDVAMKFIREHQGNFSVNDFLCDSNDTNQREVMRYYRSLYHIMKYVHLSQILDNDEEKRIMYFDIIQAQMTDEELNTVLYLLFTDEWKDSTKVLGCSLIQMMDKYHLFKNYYYAQNEKNFKEFVAFMNEEFKETKDYFHFLKME